MCNEAQFQSALSWTKSMIQAHWLPNKVVVQQQRTASKVYGCLIFGFVVAVIYTVVILTLKRANPVLVSRYESEAFDFPVVTVCANHYANIKVGRTHCEFWEHWWEEDYETWSGVEEDYGWQDDTSSECSGGNESLQLAARYVTIDKSHATECFVFNKNTSLQKKSHPLGHVELAVELELLHYEQFISDYGWGRLAPRSLFAIVSKQPPTEINADKMRWTYVDLPVSGYVPILLGLQVNQKLNGVSESLYTAQVQGTFPFPKSNNTLSLWFFTQENGVHYLVEQNPLEYSVLLGSMLGLFGWVGLLFGICYGYDPKLNAWRLHTRAEASQATVYEISEVAGETQA